MQAVFPILDSATPWFWIFVGVGTVVVGVIGRWLWHAILASLREVLKEPVAEAQQTAQLAAEHAAELKEAVGVKNGNGDLMTMVARSLANQNEMFAWQREKDERDHADADWKIEHDAKDEQTRTDVAAIKAHLGLKE